MVAKMFLTVVIMLCTCALAYSAEFAGQDVIRRIEALEERDRRQQAELETLRKQNLAIETEMKMLKDRDVQQAQRIEVLEEQERVLKEAVDTLTAHVHQVTTDRADLQSNDEGITSNPGNEHLENHEGAVKLPESHSRIRQVGEGTPVIAFYATLSVHAEHLGQNQAVVFDNAITNIGHAYHTSTGAFTAPVSGVYAFSVTILSHQETTEYAYVVNGKEMSRMYAHSSDTFETSTMDAIFSLSKGDDVVIWNMDIDKFVNGYNFTAFSGFLLSENVNNVNSQIIG